MFIASARVCRTYDASADRCEPCCVICTEPTVCLMLRSWRIPSCAASGFRSILAGPSSLRLPANRSERTGRTARPRLPRKRRGLRTSKTSSTRGTRCKLGRGLRARMCAAYSPAIAVSRHESCTCPSNDEPRDVMAAEPSSCPGAGTPFVALRQQIPDCLAHAANACVPAECRHNRTAGV